MSDDSISSSQQGYPGWMMPSTPMDDYSMLRFLIDQINGEHSHAMLVQVKAVTNKGEVKEVGQVDVLPLVNMTDGDGNATKHDVVNGLPYFRLQGGAKKAVILDPKVGDIGVAVFADRDISSVKETKKQSNPGSFRRHDHADGMFFPCFLGGKPSCYIRFDDNDEKIVMSPDDDKTFFTVEKGTITLKVGNTTITMTESSIVLKSASIDHQQS